MWRNPSAPRGIDKAQLKYCTMLSKLYIKKNMQKEKSDKTPQDFNKNMTTEQNIEGSPATSLQKAKKPTQPAFQSF